MIEQWLLYSKFFSKSLQCCFPVKRFLDFMEHLNAQKEYGCYFSFARFMIKLEPLE
jgi:hypothetical protein